MNAEHVEAVAQVIERALDCQRKTLEILIEQRRAECIDAQQASELAREQVADAEDRLREFLQHRTTEAVVTMQHAAAAELARSQDLLLRRMQTADALAAEVRELHSQLQHAQPKAAEPGKAGADGAGIDSPPWAPGIHREGALVQAYLGQFYRALRDTTDEPYGSKDWQRVGTMGLHVAKPYAEGVEYQLGDLVMRDYSTFLVDERGQLHLFAARGQPGDKGKDAKGKDAEPATPGRDGYSIEDMQLKGGTLAILARDAQGQMQHHDVDLVPLLETLGQAIEERLARRLRAPSEGAQP